ncbi:type II toxin-antitoxin system death-on-curing family toxin [Candidatus Albibeggiatoa sp. nov. BB20]|uniref:type II toxin-antitoxin system death-on-curing family toxin n=1 Tax=Candidatus Albibeggiatoa sp. nov. BB20 TaxID=3162723 RepID=UPI00336582B4
MKLLNFQQVIQLHQKIIAQTGGMQGLRNQNALESAIAQPLVSFAGEELYPTLEDKAAALGYSLICNHPFVDGNKRIGHAAMEATLLLNGFEIEASIDEQESIILAVAASKMNREAFTQWLKEHIKPFKSEK